MGKGFLSSHVEKKKKKKRERREPGPLDVGEGKMRRGKKSDKDDLWAKNHQVG